MSLMKTPRLQDCDTSGPGVGLPGDFPQFGSVLPIKPSAIESAAIGSRQILFRPHNLPLTHLLHAGTW